MHGSEHCYYDADGLDAALACSAHVLEGTILPFPLASKNQYLAESTNNHLIQLITDWFN